MTRLYIALITIQLLFFGYKIYELDEGIKESRHREDLLYQEVKNLDYITSILTEQFKDKK